MSYFYQNGEQEGWTDPVWRVDTSEKREDTRKEYRRVNMVEILSTHVHKWKNKTC
jgi:hypothetical protein